MLYFCFKKVNAASKNIILSLLYCYIADCILGIDCLAIAAGSCRWDFGGWLVAEAGDYGRGEQL
jgi:hypothetical protein